ncbi:MAG: helix-turn-helix transcriptional regulator [Armatimonadetes bacterium]|nr:helix-turn-helix transcriptional regulator [Armatimonadota bacterium]
MSKPWRTLLAERLEDPSFQREWERTAVARALAIWLCEYRGEHGLTQDALAALLGMKQSAIARLEIGETEPKLSTLLRLSRALGTPLELVVDRTGDLSEAERVVVGGPQAKAA